MNYTISLSENRTYLRIRVFDVITGTMAREFAEKAIKEARKRSIKKFLVDVRGTTNASSTFEKYQFGYEDMNQFALDRTSKIAIFTDTGDKSHNFIETVFLNAGYNCRLFSDEDAALKWLGE